MRKIECIIEILIILMVCYAMYLFDQPRQMECSYETDKTQICIITNFLGK